MRILSSPNSLDRKIKERKNANKDCDRCPFCGRSSEPYAYRCVIGGFKNILNTKIFKRDIYKCDSCHAEWESETYEEYYI